MSKDRFFFEEDPAATGDTQLTWEEHADAFFNIIGKDRGDVSFEPHDVGVDMKTEHKATSLLDIEYGVVRADYVIHITPIHAHKNLTKLQLLNQAVLVAAKLLHSTISSTQHADIMLPRADYEVKVISLLIRDGANAWNLDTKKIEEELVPQLLEQIGKICMLA